MSLLKEFKEFAMKGSIIDLAVAVIIGAAFGKIISSMVDNILMPVIGSFIGSNFANLTASVNGVEIKYGLFIQATVDFIIVAFLLFLIIKAMNNMHRRKEVVATVAPSATEILLTEIRDLLKRG
jgi:large conductance mechanosensitive channel